MSSFHRNERGPSSDTVTTSHYVSMVWLARNTFLSFLCRFYSHKSQWTQQENWKCGEENGKCYSGKIRKIDK